jgi:hypothetical protein
MSEGLTKHSNYDRYFEPATILEAEGARIALVNCKICGAAIMLDPRDDGKVNYARVHGEWHEQIRILQCRWLKEQQ